MIAFHTHILEHFPIALGAEILPLGNRGGFSGARLWRARGPAGDFCIRAWPPAGIAPNSLRDIHRLMDRARRTGLVFVPTVHRAGSGETVLDFNNRLWDVTAWMPGEADCYQCASPSRLANACLALARLHEAWRDVPYRQGPCPAVLRRLERFQQWQALLESGWRPDFTDSRLEVMNPWAERAWAILPFRLSSLLNLLCPWLSFDLPLQPCLCDIWHDHVLFTGDEVTGLVDYGSVKIDHVAVDLARLLGSMVGDDKKMWAVDLDAYCRLRNLSDKEIALVDVLDKTGTLLGAANWLVWIYHQGRKFENLEGAARRLATLVERLEMW